MSELGYFVTADGIKSTELDRKHRLRPFKDGVHKPKKVASAYMYYFMEM